MHNFIQVNIGVNFKPYTKKQALMFHSSQTKSSA